MLQILWESAACLKSCPSLKSKKWSNFVCTLALFSHAGSHTHTYTRTHTHAHILYIQTEIVAIASYSRYVAIIYVHTTTYVCILFPHHHLFLYFYCIGDDNVHNTHSDYNIVLANRILLVQNIPT